MSDHRDEGRLSKTRQRRQTRSKVTADRRRRALLERLETRHLLTGPELFAIRPDELALLEDGDVLHIAPREFNLLFKGGADIDPSTILNNIGNPADDSVRLVRSGGDGIFGNGNDVVVDLGFVGLEDPNNPVQIVLRPASSAQHNSVRAQASFPDDHYRIEIIGTGATPLTDTALGDPANSGTDVFRTFRLDLGAQVTATVPQPITRTSANPTNSLSQDRKQIVVYFDDQDLNLAAAQDPKFYRLIDNAITSNETGGSKDKILLPQTVVYNSAQDTATLNFASDIPEGSYRLEIGQADEPNGTLATAISAGTLFSGSPYSYLSYLGDHDGATSTNAADLDLYKVNLRDLTTLSVVASPHDAAFDVRLRLLNSSGTDITAMAAYVDGAAGVNDTLTYVVPALGGGDFYVEVSSGAQFGSYRLNMTGAGAGAAVPASDTNSSLAQAFANSSLGTLGSNPITLSSQIQSQPVSMPVFPGGNDEPGHRLIQAEDHGAGSGVVPTVPGSIGVVSYHFPVNLGFDPSSQPYPNLITEQEKLLVREILDVYSTVTGVQFREGVSGGTAIGKGDLRAADPASINGPGGVAGLGGPGLVVLDGAEGWASDDWGSPFFGVMFHEIGHALGLGHGYDLAAVMGGSAPPGQVFPGDHDIVHLQRIRPPNSTDIDLYQFNLASDGTFSAETTAERRANSSLLNTVLTLFDSTGNIVARNDDYFGNDSFLQVNLQPGVYYVGVTSTGNTEYNPLIPDTGFGGRSDGLYDLSLSFAAADAGATLSDSNGTAIDGDANGLPGGFHSFWFESSDNTIFVDKQNDTTANQVDGDGSLATPRDTISAALLDAGLRIVVPVTGGEAIKNLDFITVGDGISAAQNITFLLGAPGFAANTVFFSVADTPAVVAANIAGAINLTFPLLTPASVVAGRVVKLDSTKLASLDVSRTEALLHAPNVVRIVGNGGLDNSLGTIGDNRPYLVGLNNSSLPLADGQDFLTPQGTTVMIDGGALIKMQKANLDAGTTSALNDRRQGAIQVLGTPVNSVFLRSLRNDTVGGDSDGVGPAAAPGDFGGIVLRNDSDLESQRMYLNYVNHANIQHGGGKVFVEASEAVYHSIHLDEARPTVTFNVIQNGSAAAMSADPNSFDDAQQRIGPDIHGNYLFTNTINGLFVRIETSFGTVLDPLTVNGRWNDTDITHVLTENLAIAGNPGGAGGPTYAGGNLPSRAAGRLAIDPGIVVKANDSRIELVRGQSHLIAEGTADRPIIITSVRDDRFGGSGTFDTTGDGASSGVAGDWAGILLNHASRASIDYALIAFGGGDAPIEGGADRFDVIEVHQAELRVTNSTIENNAAGGSTTPRNGRGQVPASTIYVRGAQPVLVGNIIQNNAAAVISINADSLQSTMGRDYGRSTDTLNAFGQFADNRGPLVRLNRLKNNATNGMEVRAESLTTETIWDDTDIVHVLRGTITVDNFHTYNGVRLQSSNTESLVVKLSGGSAGFTAAGKGLDIDDRIGGTVQVIGSVGHPVVLTSLTDDSVGAGFTPEGAVLLDTNNNGASIGVPGAWRGLLFDRFSNDRNVEVIRELESVLTNANDVNWTVGSAQALGTLAKDQKSGDENSRLGFEVHGFVSPDDPTDVDVYSFNGTAGTEVWIDLDRTDPALDSIVELISSSSALLARSTDMPEALGAGANPTGSAGPQPLGKEPLLGGDYYSLNRLDAGMRVVLPGTPGSAGTYFVRVRSMPPPATINSLKGAGAGLTTGEYQLQIRLQQRDEKAGSAVRYSDIRFATTGIDIRGLPAHSPLLGESSEVGMNEALSIGQDLANLLQTDLAALSIGGSVVSDTDVDFYGFDLNHIDIQSIGGVNDAGKTVAVVFDLDYADGAVRPDATVSVFDEQGTLIWVGRESNVANDQPAPGQGTDTDDLSRGSLGVRDGYIGPVHIPVGTPSGTKRRYYVAISSDREQPTVLNAYFSGDPGNPAMLTRLEPINSVQRVIEDHIGFQGYRSNGAQQDPVDLQDPDAMLGLFDLTNKTTLDAHVTPFALGDVPLYVISGSATGGGGDDRLYTANPFSGGSIVTRVSATADVTAGGGDVQDIVMRSDGLLYGYRRVDNSATVVGERGTISTDTGAYTAAGADNIPDRSPTPAFTTPATNNVPQANDLATTDSVDALTYERLGTVGNFGTAPDYDLYYAVREMDVATAGLVNSKLYRANAATGSAARAAKGGVNNFYGERGDIQPTGVTFATRDFNFFDNAGPPVNTARVRVESKLAGTDGNAIVVTITRADAANNATCNVGAGTVNVTLDTNPQATAGNMIDEINNDATCRRMVAAYLTFGATGGDSTNGPGAGSSGNLAGGADGAVSAFNGLNGPLNGYVTGLAFNQFTGGTLFGVTSQGELLIIDKGSGTVTKRIDFSADIAPFNFQGLALGPQNVENGNYANTLFAITSNGTLYAIDSTVVAGINAALPASRLTALRPIFSGGATSTTITGMANNALGLAFSPLDFNLWHPTTARAGNAGHGVNTAVDNSRNPGNESITISDPAGTNRDSNEGAGGASFYFGFEQVTPIITSGSQSYLTYTAGNRSQLGILNEAIQNDLSSNAAIAGTYNLPAGGLGSLVTSRFSLLGNPGAPITKADKPTLYFTYFLNTEADNGSAIGSDGTTPFRDSARVFISTNNGASWELLATNNSQLSSGDVSDANGQAELPSFLSHHSNAALNSGGARAAKWQQVQELFDNTGQWRQARIDLAEYAGQANLRLRFDFSTAGSMNDTTLTIAGNSMDGQCDPMDPMNATMEFGEYCSTTRSIRSTSNQFEGFYVDDIIIGFSERGEMVTGNPVSAVFSDLQTGRTNRNNDPEAQPEVYTGDYQLEVRRTGEYAGLTDTGEIVIGSTFDTNDRHIISPVTATEFDGFESGGFAGIPGWATPPTVPITVAGNTVDWVSIGTTTPWTNSTLSPYRGTRSARGGTGALAVVSGLELTKNGLQAGLISFAYTVNSTDPMDGLLFFIDGVPQRLAGLAGESTTPANPYIATGNLAYTTATFPFSGGDHVFTWVKANVNGTADLFIDDVTILQGGTGLLADENRQRAQGQFIVDSSFVTNSSQVGINVQAGGPDAGLNVPHPGSLIRFVSPNLEQIAPGVVIQNNVVANSGQVGIRFAGDTSTAADNPLPFGRIVNNTVYGGNRIGTGIQILNNASPTVMNNIVAGLSVGITGLVSNPSAVVRSNFYQDNSLNGDLGTDQIVEPNPAAPLFANPADRNFYLLSGSDAIDSSLNTLQDRPNYVSFKNNLGLPPSPIFAPDRDVYGQLRVDDINEDPIGGGSSVFKDRGAIDRADTDRPYAVLLVPVDNDAAFEDLDRNATVVYRQNVFLDVFSILLGDGASPNSPFQGTGVDPNILTDLTDADVSHLVVKLTRNGQPLIEGVDYTLGFSDANDVLLLTPLSSLWEPQSVYQITLDNSYDPAAIGLNCVATPQDDKCIGIRDLAGNPLRHNQPNGTTVFTIILGTFAFDFGDAPNSSFGTVQTSDGARHVLVPNDPDTAVDEAVFLGSRVDGDQDGVSTPLADGDDREQAVGLGTSSLTLLPRPPFHLQFPGGAGLLDNDTFVINDGVNPPRTFQFDLGEDGILPVTNAAIPYFTPDPVDVLAERVVTAINAQVTGGALTGIVARHLGAGVVLISGNVGTTVTAAASIAVSNRLPVGLQVPPMGIGQIMDTMLFSVNDGVNPPVTFEFDDVPAGVTLGNIAVPFSTVGYNPVTIAASIATAINSQTGPGNPLGNLPAMAASSSGSTVSITTLSGGSEDDEDGVTIQRLVVPTGIGPGYLTPVSVVASAAGFLDGWIDFNGNSTFEAAEQVYDSVPVVPGVNNLTPVNIASVVSNVSVVSGLTYARFRVSQNGDLFPTGLGVGGEVEDHQSRIFSNAAPVIQNAFGTFIDGRDSALAMVANGQLDVREDELHDAVSAGVDFVVNLRDINPAIPPTPGNGYLDDVFNDPDIHNGNADALTYSLVTNSNSSLVAASVVGSELRLDFLQDRNGQAVLTVRATDLAGLSITETLTVNVRAVNDPPTVNLPAPLALNEGSPPFVVTGVTVSDLDDIETAPPDIRVTLQLVTAGGVATTTNGTLTVAPGSLGATVTVIDASTVRIDGPEAALNAILGGVNGSLTYTLPNGDFNDLNNSGPVRIKITADDLGKTGVIVIGQTDIETLTINVTPVNDPPVLNIAGSMPVSILEGAAPVVLTGVTLTDVDDTETAPPDIRLTLQLINASGVPTFAGGSLTVAPGLLGATVTVIDAATVRIDGTEAAINAILAGTNGSVTYTLPNSDFNNNNGGPVRIKLTADDLGKTLPPPATTPSGLDVETVTLNVTAQNDAPDVTGPASAIVNEDAPAGLVFSAAGSNQIIVTDVDAGEITGADNIDGGRVAMTLTVSHGRLTLASTAGLVAVVGNGTSGTVTFRGTPADVTTALNGLRYDPDLNYNVNLGAESLTVVVDDQGNTGTEVGTSLSDTHVIPITVTALNDPPALDVTVATPTVINEGSAPVVITGILMDDPDETESAPPNLRLTLQLVDAAGAATTTKGSLVVAAGSLGTAVTVLDASTVRIDGAEPAIDAILAGTNGSITYSLPNSDFNNNVGGPVRIKLTSDDFGRTGLPVVGTTDIETLTIDVTPLNDAPAISAPAGASVNEDAVGGLVFSPGNSNAIGVTDVDAGETAGPDNVDGGQVAVTLSVSRGILTLGGTAGLDAVTGNGTSSSVMFRGTPAEVTAALNGLRYNPNLHYNVNLGPEMLVVIVDDQGNTGLEPVGLTSQMTTVSIPIAVVAQNDAPTVNGPASPTVMEDDPAGLVFSTTGGNAVTIGDVDALEFAGPDNVDSGRVSVTLSVLHGRLTLGGTANLVNLMNNGTSSVTFRGLPADVNVALNGLRYDPNLHYNVNQGPEVLSVRVDDQGNTGAEPVGVPSQITVSSITVTVTAKNDAPGITSPATGTVNEDHPTGLVFSAAGANAIVVTDVDAGESLGPDNTDGGNVAVTLTVLHGRLTLAGTAGLDGVTGNGTSGTVGFRGTPAEVTAALNGLRYDPTLDYNVNLGAETLTVSVDDQGNTGDEPAGVTSLITVQSIPITVAAQNDAPQIAGPISATMLEDDSAGLVFSSVAGNQIVVTDVDAGESAGPDFADAGRVSVSLSVTRGVLNLASTTNLVNVVGDGTSSILFRGTPADVTAAVNGLRYTPQSNYNINLGADALTIQVNDQGNVGAEPTGLNSLTTTRVIPITVSARNDAPVITAPASASVDEDHPTGLVFSPGTGNPITVADVDAGETAGGDNTDGGQVSVTLTVLHGRLTLGSIAGLDALVGHGTSGVVTFRGTPAEVTAALNGLRYDPDPNYNRNPQFGGETLTVRIDDQGNTGSEPIGLTSLVSQTVIPITVNPLNDVPQFSLVSTASANEDDALAPAVTTIASAATNIAPGPATALDEDQQSEQTVAFLINVTSVTGNLAFDLAPSISPATGDLTFRTAPNTSGTAVLEVRLRDFVAGTPIGGADLTSAVQRLTLTINSFNDLPEFTPGPNVVSDEDQGLTVLAGWATNIRPGPATATDEIGQTLTFEVLASNPTLFSIAPSIDPVTGALQFRPADDENGQSTITIRLRDSLGAETAPVVRTITVREINDSPIVSPPLVPPHSYAMLEDGGRTDNLPSGAPLSIPATDLTSTPASKDLPGPANESAQTLTIDVSSVGPASARGGTVSVSGGLILYTPAVNVSGVDTFTYRIVDNGTSRGIADPKSATGTITVNITPVNDAPIAINDPPAANLASYTTDENDVLVVAGVGVILNDLDENVPGLVVTVLDTATLNTKGMVEFLPSIPSNGDFRYTPGTQFDTLAQGQTATDLFRYQVQDTDGLVSNLGTVTVTIRGRNDAPRTSPISLTTTEDASLVNRPFVGTDVDIEPTPQPLAFSIVTNVPAGQGTVINHGNGTFTFNPGTAFQDLRNGESRTVQFTYKATDQRGADSNESVVNIVVTGSNDAPTANTATIVASEDGPTAGSFPASDVDDAPNTLTFRIISQPAAGSVSVGANGSFTFHSNGAFEGLQVGQTQQVQFTYGVEDPQAVESTAVITVSVTGVNDAPTASPILMPIAEDGGSVTGNFVGDDADDDDNPASLSFLITTNVPAGQGTLVNNNNGSVTYQIGTAFQDLAIGETRDVTYGYRARDRHGALSDVATATIRVTGINDVPVADPVSVFASKSANRLITLVGSDVDTGETGGLVYSILGGLGAGNGTLGPVVGNTVLFLPGSDFSSLSAGQSRQVTFSYQTRDVHDSFSVPGTVTITVSGDNDPPTAGNLALSAVEDGPSVSGLLPGDDINTNDDPDTLTYRLLTVPPAGQGSVILSGVRTIAFNPGGDFQNLSTGQTQQVFFSYQVTDRFGIDAPTPGTVTVTVTGQNDAPVVSNLASLPASEDGLPVGGSFVGQDADDGAAGLVYSIVTQPSEGLVTLTGLAGFEFNPGTAFQNLAGGQQRTVTFTYRATDPSSTQSNVGTGTVTVTGANDAPVAQNVSGIAAQEDGGPVAGNFNAVDVDSDENGGGLVYSINTPPAPGNGSVLPLSGNPGDRGFTFDPGTDFQDLALGEVRDVTFTYRAADTHGAIGPVGTVTVSVTGRNEAPVVDPVSVSGAPGQTTINGLFSAVDLDNDEDGGGLVYSIVTPPAFGAVNTSGVPGDRAFAFDATSGFADLAQGETRVVTFTYKASDAHGAQSAPQSVTVTVTGANDAPVAQPVSSFAVEDGGAVVVTFAGDDVDSDDGPTSLVYTITSPPPSGTLTNNGNGTATFVPGSGFQALSAGETQSVTFTYTVRDRYGVDSAPATGTITVTGVNDAPVALPVSATTTESGELTQSFGATDLDPDNEDNTASLGYVIVSGPPAGQGTVRVNPGGTFTYTPGSGFDGLALGETLNVLFSFRATDRRGASSGVATVTVSVTGQNDAPLAQPVTVAAVEHGSNAVAAFNADDPDSDDDGGSLTYSLLDTVLTTVIDQQTKVVGTLTNNNNGSFTFRPDPDFRDLGAGQTLALTARYRGTDAHGAQSGVATVTINLTGVNDSPTAKTDQVATSEEALLVVEAPGVLGAPSDPNRDLDPDQGDSLTVVAFDSTSAFGASVSVSASGSFRYDPRNVSVFNNLPAGGTLVDTFRYTIQDAFGAQASGTVSVTVTGQNDPPQTVNDSFPANADEVAAIPAPGVLQNDSDPDGDGLTVISSSNVSQRGAVVQVAPNGGFQYFPNNVAAFQALRDGESLQDTFIYTTSDGSGGTAQGTATITVFGANDPPVAVNDQYSASEDNTLSVARTNGVLRNDQDAEGDALSAILVSGPANGQLLSFSADGSFIYRPNANFNGLDTFVYRANDGGLESNNATVTIGVSSVNDVPTAVNDSYSVAQGSALNVSAANGVLKNDTDLDSSGLTATLVRTAANGSLNFNPDGSFTYTPAASFSGQDNFTYRVTDTDGGVSNVATVTINVSSGNPWQNPRNRFDVNDDGSVSPIDVLILVNDLNARGARPLPIPPVPPFTPPPYLDVNGDRSVTPQDALAVINHLNGVGSEGEAAAEYFASPSVPTARSARASDPALANFGFVVPVAPPIWPDEAGDALQDRQQSENSLAGTIVRLDASNVPIALVCETDAGDSVGADSDALDELVDLLADDCPASGDFDSDWALVELFGRD